MNEARHVVVLAALLVASVGRAEAEEPRRADFGGGVELVAGPAFAWWSPRQDASSTGAQMGALASLRFRALRLAAFAEATGIILGPTVFHWGGGIGWVWMPTSAIQFDALLEAGASQYERVGNGIFVEAISGKTSALLPFVGLRVGLGWRFARILILGVWVQFREDLTRATLSQSVTSCFVSCDTHQVEWTVGGAALALGLKLGVDL